MRNAPEDLKTLDYTGPLTSRNLHHAPAQLSFAKYRKQCPLHPGLLPLRLVSPRLLLSQSLSVAVSNLVLRLDEPLPTPRAHLKPQSCRRGPWASTAPTALRAAWSCKPELSISSHIIAVIPLPHPELSPLPPLPCAAVSQRGEGAPHPCTVLVSLGLSKSPLLRQALPASAYTGVCFWHLQIQAWKEVCVRALCTVLSSLADHVSSEPTFPFQCASQQRK